MSDTDEQFKKVAELLETFCAFHIKAKTSVMSHNTSLRK